MQNVGRPVATYGWRASCPAGGVTDGVVDCDALCVPDMRVTYEVRVLDARIQN
jgi:hypothetical protein